MADRQPTCPKCSNKLVWNGVDLCCIGCSYVTPVPQAKPKSEKKLPTPRKLK